MSNGLPQIELRESALQVCRSLQPITRPSELTRSHPFFNATPYSINHQQGCAEFGANPPLPVCF